MKSIALYLCLVSILIAVAVGCQGNQPSSVPTPLPTETVAPPTPLPTSLPPTIASSTLPPTDIPLQEPPPIPTVANTATPNVPPPSVIEVAGAELLPGFSMIQFAPMFRPTSLAFDQNGRLFATSFDGTVHLFTDEDGDGRADRDDIFYSGLQIPLGITVHEPTGDVYVSSNGRISILRDLNNDLKADEVEVLVSGIPTGLHQNDNLKFGPDGWLYMGVGSTCDACFEADPRSASMMGNRAGWVMRQHENGRCSV